MLPFTQAWRSSLFRKKHRFPYEENDESCKQNTKQAGRDLDDLWPRYYKCTSLCGQGPYIMQSNPSTGIPNKNRINLHNKALLSLLQQSLRISFQLIPLRRSSTRSLKKGLNAEWGRITMIKYCSSFFPNVYDNTIVCCWSYIYFVIPPYTCSYALSLKVSVSVVILVIKPIVYIS